jgi:hypothetical protein
MLVGTGDPNKVLARDRLQLQQRVVEQVPGLDGQRPRPPCTRRAVEPWSQQRGNRRIDDSGGDGGVPTVCRGHNHMVDRLHFLASGAIEEFCFCFISQP